MKTTSLTVCTTILALLALALFFLAANSGAEDEDPLTYSFEDTGEEEETARDQDSVDYELEGLSKCDISPQLKVENHGDKAVNFSFAAFTEPDLDPNPNNEEEQKIDPHWVSGTWELDAGRSRTFVLDIEIADSLVSYEDPYVLSLHFRNEDQKISHDREVRMLILPVYALELVDEFGNIKREIKPGDTLDFNLLLRNVGNAEDDVELEAKLEGDGMTATITKPQGTVYENVAPELQGSLERYPVNVKFNTDEQVEEGVHYVTVKATSLNDGDTEASVEYKITVKIATISPPPPPPPPPSNNIPLWVWFGIVGLIGAGGGGSTLIFLKSRDDEEEDDDWAEDDWDYRNEDDPDPQDPKHNMPREQPAIPRTVTAPRPQPGGAARVKCPRCRTPFRVGSKKRPLKVKCPGCLSPVTLKGKANERAPVRQGAPSSPRAKGPARVGCPKCKARFKVMNPKRPLKVKCPGCETHIILKGKKAANPGPQPEQTQQKNLKDPAKLKCPGCHTHFKIRNPKRPLKVKCPGCEKVLTLK